MSTADLYWYTLYLEYFGACILLMLLAAYILYRTVIYIGGQP